MSIEAEAMDMVMAAGVTGMDIGTITMATGNVFIMMMFTESGSMCRLQSREFEFFSHPFIFINP